MDHLVSVATVGLLDVVMRHCIRPSHKVEHTRWCAVHAATNALVAFLSLPSLVAVSLRPADCLSTSSTRLPVALAMWLHAYHVLCYRLSSDDRLHHLLFVAILGIPSYLHARPATNLMLFFMSGAPGGLIYALIACRRCGIARSWDEPRFSARVNLFFRAPGVLWGSYCLLAGASRRADIPRPILGMQLVLPVLNAVYYAHQSVRRASGSCAQPGVGAGTRSSDMSLTRA